MLFNSLKNNRFIEVTALFLMLCFHSCAQDRGSFIQDPAELLSEKMEQNKDFFDALRLRTDLNLGANKRILYTTIDDIKDFDQNYKGTEMSLEYVIRDRLHTAIFLNQKKNQLQSMDGSEFGLSQRLSAVELTNELVSLIGSMYYGAEEVKALE